MGPRCILHWPHRRGSEFESSGRGCWHCKPSGSNCSRRALAWRKPTGPTDGTSVPDGDESARCPPPPFRRGPDGQSRRKGSRKWWTTKKKKRRKWKKMKTKMTMTLEEKPLAQTGPPSRRRGFPLATPNTKRKARAFVKKTRLNGKRSRYLLLPDCWNV